MKAALAKIIYWFICVSAGLTLGLVFLYILVNSYYDIGVGGDLFEEGSAYGITIGSTKKETFGDLLEYYKDSPVEFVAYYIPDSPRTFGLDDPAAEEILRTTDLWYFHPDDDHWITFKLYFRNEKLIKIYRFWGDGL